MELSSTRGSSLSLSARKLCGLFWSIQIYGKQGTFVHFKAKQNSCIFLCFKNIFLKNIIFLF